LRGRGAGMGRACDARLNGDCLKLTVISVRHDPSLGFGASGRQSCVPEQGPFSLPLDIQAVLE